MRIFADLKIGNKQLTAKQILYDPVLFLAFGFGSGLARKAPGTVGTLSALPIYWLLSQTNTVIYSLVTITVCASGIWICGQASDKLGENDFGGIVWDEIAGYLVTLWGVPYSWQAMLAGFLLFRYFDIVKPWPIRQIDKNLHGGLGIMLDDIVAGLFAAIILLFIMPWMV